MSQPIETRTAPAAPPYEPRAESGPAPSACTNCAAPLHGAWCSACGEKQPDAQDWSLAGLAHEAVHTFTNVDGTLWRTLRTLVVEPGLLTADYFAGRKTRYMRPMALFIALNVVFFVIQPRVGLFNWRYDTYARVESRQARMEARRAELELSPAKFRERFDASLNDKKRSMLLVEIPLFALAVAVVQLRRRRPLAQHVVFAIHSYAFFALYLGIVLVGLIVSIELALTLARSAELATVARGMAAVRRVVGSEAGIDTMLATGLGVWLSLAIRRVYGGSWVASIAGALVLLMALLAMISYQGRAVFELTLRTL